MSNENTESRQTSTKENKEVMQSIAIVDLSHELWNCPASSEILEIARQNAGKDLASLNLPKIDLQFDPSDLKNQIPDEIKNANSNRLEEAKKPGSDLELIVEPYQPPTICTESYLRKR